MGDLNIGIWFQGGMSKRWSRQAHELPDISAVKIDGRDFDPADLSIDMDGSNRVKISAHVVMDMISAHRNQVARLTEERDELRALLSDARQWIEEAKESKAVDRAEAAEKENERLKGECDRWFKLDIESRAEIEGLRAQVEAARGEAIRVLEDESEKSAPCWCKGREEDPQGPVICDCCNFIANVKDRLSAETSNSRTYEQGAEDAKEKASELFWDWAFDRPISSEDRRRVYNAIRALRIEGE